MPDLGTKHECSSCGSKFYDLGKDEPICPKCGLNQLAEEEEPAPPEPEEKTAEPKKKAAEEKPAEEAPKTDGPEADAADKEEAGDDEEE